MRHPQSPPPSPPDAGPADRFGPYRILQVLGQGGMGVVYEAEQTSPIQRRVALKIVRTDVATSEVVSRFDAERQALAVMTHDSIAKVLDAGTSESGRPYFVMELVRGVPITDYCDTHKLTTRQRIELFIPVCRAVQHAHQKGVIHRDLKPSNVLVTESDGRPLAKIIDFGIAKAVGLRLTEQTLVTMAGQAVGTLAYMSPEQAERSGLDVDTRTDVFSLGVMLYEVLVGLLPVDPQELGLPGFLSRLVLRTTEPLTPSAKLASLAQDREAVAQMRSTDADSLRRQLHGDLDWVVMRAMELDRNHRYQTANALAADLERYLRDEPVEARPPSAAYRLRKFVRRHRLGVVAAAAVVAALLTGAVAATLGLVRATRAEARAREEAATAQQVLRFLTGLFDVSNPTRARGNAITAREILDSGATRIGRELTDQPRVQARLMNTIGDVYAELGLYPEAEALLRKSLATRQRLLGDDSAEVGVSLTSLGSVLTAQAHYPEAETTLVRAVRIARETADASTEDRLTSMRELAELYRLRGRYAPADTLMREALTMAVAALGPDHADVARVTEQLAMSQAEQGRPAAAESLFRQVVTIRERAFGADDPAVATAMGNLASSLYEQGKIAPAESLYRRQLEIDTKAYGAEHSRVGVDLYNVGNIEAEKGRHAEAIALFERARQIWVKAFGPDHPYVAAALTAQANSYGKVNEPARAEPLLRQALTIRQHTMAPDHPFIGTTLHELGTVYTQLQRYAEAESHLRRALAIREKALEPTSFYIAVTQAALGDLYREQGRTADALPMYERAVKQWNASGRARDEMWTDMVKGYVALLRKLGRTADADALARESARP